MHGDSFVVRRCLAFASVLLTVCGCTHRVVYPKPKEPSHAVTTINYTGVPDSQRRFPDYTQIDARILR